ncbi:DUF6777 domain-containing protein [Streptomyces sp. CC228A]|uniref:DUF6777 domain-containing protein n=1 Tax=Streptomyces sp. CC228A TaxID=2898186 RepID=UPI001F2F40B5|nr:DUF6777 domain-containing protein [Streptomyces sp. CC228A]
MRPPTRRRSPRTGQRPGAYVAVAAAAGLLATGCGGGGAPAPSGSPAPPAALLQPAAEPGPHPFTASTVLTSDTAARHRPSPGPAAGAAASAGEPLRTVDGATPGLYGGTQSLASCDIEQQVRFLTADTAKAEAFARAAGVSRTGLAQWLRGLTPVMLRADTHVAGHGYRKGNAVPYQAVLQAGTAVLVDAYGAPRVRCADGNPLRSPADGRLPAAQRGRAWDGYRPERVIAVHPTVRTLETLVLVNVVNDTWLERKVGTGGEQDRKPPCPPRTTRRSATSPTGRSRTAAAPPRSRRPRRRPRGTAAGGSPCPRGASGRAAPGGARCAGGAGCRRARRPRAGRRAGDDRAGRACARRDGARRAAGRSDGSGRVTGRRADARCHPQKVDKTDK